VEVHVLPVAGPGRRAFVAGSIDLGTEILGRTPRGSRTLDFPDIVVAVATGPITVEVKITVQVTSDVSLADPCGTSIYPCVAAFIGDVDLTIAGEIQVIPVGGNAAAVLIGRGIHARAKVFSGFPCRSCPMRFPDIPAAVATGEDSAEVEIVAGPMPVRGFCSWVVDWRRESLGVRPSALVLLGNVDLTVITVKKDLVVVDGTPVFPGGSVDRRAYV